MTSTELRQTLSADCLLVGQLFPHICLVLCFHHFFSKSRCSLHDSSPELTMTLTSTESHQTLYADGLLVGQLIPHICLVVCFHHFFSKFRCALTYSSPELTMKLTSTESHQTLCADVLLVGPLIPHVRLALGLHHFFSKFRCALTYSSPELTMKLTSTESHQTLCADVLLVGPLIPHVCLALGLHHFFSKS